MSVRSTLLTILVSLGVAAHPARAGNGLDQQDRTALQVCEGIIRSFERAPDAVWLGYYLARRPVVVYRPGRWALLLGHEEQVPGYTFCPSDWPDLGHPARFQGKPPEELAGQLVFNYQVGDVKTLAIGLPDDPAPVAEAQALPPEAVLLAYVVHEAFHQYQYEAFGEIPWAREAGQGDSASR